MRHQPPTPSPHERHLPAWLGLWAPVTVLLTCLACGPASPSPVAPTRDGDGAQPTAGAAEPGGGDEASPPKPAGGGCYEACARRLRDASALLAKARAMGDAPNVAVAFGQAGDAFERAWRGCDLREPSGTDVGCPGADTLLDDMAKAYRSAERMDGQVLANLIALDPRWQRAGQPLASAAPDELRRLAAEAKKLAHDDPKNAAAPRALRASVYAQLALSAPTDAAAAAREFSKLYGAREPDDVSLLAAALGEWHIARGEWDQASAALAPSTAPIRAKEPRVKILWHAARGAALSRGGTTSGGRASFDEVSTAWGHDGPADPAKLIGPQSPRPMLDRESVVEAVGRARLGVGQELAAKAAQLTLPAYRGPATTKGVNDYVKTTMADWMKRRQLAVEEAQRAYAEVRRIRPVPPPVASTEAAAATGRAWADFAAAVGAAPAPAAVTADPELSAAWQQSTTEASQALLGRAREAFSGCRAAGQSEPRAAPAARACGEWLDAHPSH